MKFIREHKKLSIILLISLVFLILCGITFGKYIYNAIDNYILETKGFYFKSSVLSMNTKEYKISNWDGANSYALTVDLSNKKNQFVSTDADISYSVEVSCSKGVTCTTSLDANSGILYKNDSDGATSFEITMIPDSGVVFNSDDTVEVLIEVTATSPYKKKISAKYFISVENADFSYNIVDSSGDSIFTLNLTNSLAYYEVEQAFGSHKIGNLINLEDYEKLSSSDKDKCFSAKVTIEFEPGEIFLDMTNRTYLHRIKNSEKTIKIKGHDYISKYTFNINATSSEKVLFYKDLPSNNFTYPIVNNSSIIDVDVLLAGNK